MMYQRVKNITQIYIGQAYLGACLASSDASQNLKLTIRGNIATLCPGCSYSLIYLQYLLIMSVAGNS